MQLSQLKVGDSALIKNFDSALVPLKLVELGCLPDNKAELLQIAPLGCPMYFIINDTRVAIRKETAALIQVEKL
jgi:ferrous iron transport protein A